MWDLGSWKLNVGVESWMYRSRDLSVVILINRRSGSFEEECCSALL